MGVFFHTVNLYTAQLAEQKKFYTQKLSCKVIEEHKDSFALAIGRTQLRFTKDHHATPYHFAFNIPSYGENAALEWLKLQNIPILPFDGRPIVDFPNWQAKAIYFYDADRNVVEFIARRNLNLRRPTPFTSNHLLGISEIGIPTQQIESIYRVLEERAGLKVFDGNFEKFCAVGGEQALFIVIDHERKRWFPSNDEAFPSPFEATLAIPGERDVSLGYRLGHLGPVANRIVLAQSAPAYEAAGILFREYAAELNIELGFQNFDRELETLPRQYGGQEGCLLLIVCGHANYLGCAGVRKFDGGVAELKRMYIRPAGRGQKLGGQLLEEAIRHARAMNYQKIRLDTLPSMQSAMHLYRRTGFYEIPPYRYNPVPGTVYLEKDLTTGK